MARRGLCVHVAVSSVFCGWPCALRRQPGRGEPKMNDTGGKSSTAIRSHGQGGRLSVEPLTACNSLVIIVIGIECCLSCMQLYACLMCASLKQLLSV